MPEIRERWERVQKGASTSSIVTVVTENGEQRYVAVVQKNMVIDDERKFCLASRDVTEERNREKKLREANAKLLEHDRARSEFVFNVSHELKTPLASMSYAIGNMLKGIMGELPESVMNYIKMMKADTQRLSQTVEDILDLSRIEANTFKLDKVKIPFNRLVERSVHSIKLQAEENNLGLELALSLPAGFVACDPRKMERVILNILRNAVKFTPHGGRVRVDLSIDVENESRFCLSITDNGIGIAEKDIDKVTERYFRVGEHVDGTGLGLAISKDIVALHGGNLAICSPPPQQKNGTCVQIYIPQSKHPVVLAVDDDEDNLRLIKTMLASGGYETKCCCNGAEALEKLAGHQPDIILTDLVMPVMDGVAMIAEIKTHPEWRYIPVIAITGGELSLAKREILEGFDIPAMSKPYKFDKLLDLIETTVFGMHYLNQGS